VATSKGSIVDFIDELEAAEAELDESSSALLRIAFIATERGETLFRTGLPDNKEGKSEKNMKE
jgi:hypothetical protein